MVLCRKALSSPNGTKIHIHEIKLDQWAFEPFSSMINSCSHHVPLHQNDPHIMHYDQNTLANVWGLLSMPS